MYKLFLRPGLIYIINNWMYSERKTGKKTNGYDLIKIIQKWTSICWVEYIMAFCQLFSIILSLICKKEKNYLRNCHDKTGDFFLHFVRPIKVATSFLQNNATQLFSQTQNIKWKRLNIYMTYDIWTKTRWKYSEWLYFLDNKLKHVINAMFIRRLEKTTQHVLTQ